MFDFGSFDVVCGGWNFCFCLNIFAVERLLVDVCF